MMDCYDSQNVPIKEESKYETPGEIVRFYSNSTVFLTGGTGYLGQIFIEKLLRSCPDLRKIFVLVRSKKGKDVQARFDEIFECPIFDKLKREDENFALERVQLIAGDCAQPDLGLSPEDREKLITEVDCVIHSAATVRFDEKLKTAIDINVRSTRDLIEMAKTMKKLRSMVYISTAFSNCTRTKIDEILYDVPIKAQNLIQLSECLNEELLEIMTPTILGQNPNSYVLTKAAAEHIVKTESENLPIAVIRPSIITGSVKEPIAGWVNNVNGVNGVIAGIATGLLRNLRSKGENVADTVPADYAVNCALAAAWDVATVASAGRKPVFNFVSEPEAKITWRDYSDNLRTACMDIPSPKVLWYPGFALRRTAFTFLVAVFLTETIPAHAGDLVAKCLGKKPILVKIHRKIVKFGKVLEYFTTREWHYENANVRNLWKRMGEKDRETFEFSMADFDWDVYLRKYARAVRVYVLKDPMETVEEGRAHFRKLKMLHFGVIVVIWLMVYQVVSAIFKWKF